MALVAIKTSTGDGYCECICGCYEIASQRHEETGRGYCPRCAKEHLELNRGIGLPRVPPSKSEPAPRAPAYDSPTPAPADPPGRLR